jgi:hypothetical protein
MKYVWLVAAVILCYTTNLAFADEPKGLISFSQHKDYATYDLTKEEEWNTFEIIGKYKNSEPLIPDQTFIAQYRVINGTLESIKGDDTTVVAKVNTTDTGWFELKFPRNFPYKNTEIEDADLFIGINGYGSDVYYLPETTPMMEHVREKILNKINRPLPHPHTYSEKTDCFFVFQIPFYTYAEITIVYGWNGLIEKPYHGDQVPEQCVQETMSAQYHSSEKEKHFTLDTNIEKIPLPLDVRQSMLDWCTDSPNSLKNNEQFWDVVPIKILSTTSGFQSLHGKTNSFVIHSYSAEESCPPHVEMIGMFTTEDNDEHKFALSYDGDFFRYQIDAIFPPQYKEKTLSPLKQFKSGIQTDKIQCKENLQLIIKASDGAPACIKPETKAKLVERGWAKADIR